MSFAVSLAGRSFEWSSATLSGLFGTRANAANPAFYGMLRDMLRFNREAPAFLRRCKEAPDDPANAMSMDEFLRAHHFSDAFKCVRFVGGDAAAAAAAAL